MSENEKREKAWVGDAVLGLWAREWILRQPSIEARDRAETFMNMTSNRFLSSFGEPTHMEAKIGIVYEREGLDKAFAFLEEEFLPTFKRQEANRSKAGKVFGKRRKS